MASIGTELVLLIYASLVFYTLFVFIFFNLVSHCMGLCYVSRIMLLLLNVLLDIALTSAKCFISFSVTPWCRIRTRLTILAWRNSIAGSNNPPGLSCLEMSILVLQMCCILGRIIICSKTAGSYCVSEPIHIIRNSIVLILLQLAILIYV